MSDAFQALSRRVLPLAAAVGFALVATPALARGPDGIADVAEKVIDAVVNISTSQTVDAKTADNDKGSDETECEVSIRKCYEAPYFTSTFPNQAKVR